MRTNVIPKALTREERETIEIKIDALQEEQHKLEEQLRADANTNLLPLVLKYGSNFVPDFNWNRVTFKVTPEGDKELYKVAGWNGYHESTCLAPGMYLSCDDGEWSLSFPAFEKYQEAVKAGRKFNKNRCGQLEIFAELVHAVGITKINLDAEIKELNRIIDNYKEQLEEIAYAQSLFPCSTPTSSDAKTELSTQGTPQTSITESTCTTEVKAPSTPEAASQSG